MNNEILNSELISFEETITSNFSREKRKRLLSSSWIKLLGGGHYTRQLNYNSFARDIEHYININNQLKELEQDKRVEVFIMFIVSKLLEQIKDIEENVYHLSSVVFQIINFGMLVKITNEFKSHNPDHNYTGLYKMHEEALLLLYRIILKREEGGDWCVYKKEGKKPFYCTNIQTEKGENLELTLVTDVEEYKKGVSRILETTYSEVCSGEADFILKKEGALGWEDKKYYI